jgi:ABC-type multidrug transport system fused ATPase/permease subunit
LDSIKGNIVLDGVSFSYEKDKNVIDNINLKFENGKITALVGSSGCGKSTIVKLLSRLWDIDDGSITIDNVSQKYILKNISEFLIDKTTIVIAHRLSTIKNADRIYLIDKGRVVEEGNHYNIIEKKVIY